MAARASALPKWQEPKPLRGNGLELPDILSNFPDQFLNIINATIYIVSLLDRL
jgi:hypothetical protein